MKSLAGTVGLPLLALAVATGAWSRLPSAPSPDNMPVVPQKIEVTGVLPSVLTLQENPRGTADAGLSSGTARAPRRVAPSASRWEGQMPKNGGFPIIATPFAGRYGHNTYAPFPSDPGGDAGPGEAPKSTRENSCYLLDASVNGQKGVTLSLEVDAANLLLSARAARKLGLRVSPKGGDGYASPETVVLDSLQVGPLTFRGVTALVVTEKGVLPEPAEGVLPLWFLSGVGLQWAPERRELTLHPAETAAESVLGPQLSMASLEWRSGRPFVDVLLAGKARGPCLLNPLTEHTVFDSDVLKKAGIHYSPVLEPDPGYEWVRGISQDLPIVLGGTAVTIRRGCVVDLGLQEKSMGVLGRDLLGVFDLYVDGRRGIVALKQR